MMLEKLQKYALIAEIIGGIAIVISLLFVTLELRESNLQARANAYIQISELMSDWAFNVGANPDASKIYFEGLNDFSSLTPLEKSRFQYLMNSFYSAISGAITTRDLIIRNGDNSIREDSGNLQTLFNSVVDTPGFRQWFESEYKIDPPEPLVPWVAYYLNLE